MKLCLVTADAELARQAHHAGIERVLVDLERLGKAARQAGKGLFLSTHQLSDVARVRAIVPEMTLVVRINPLHAGTELELQAVLDAGADRVMLPMVAAVEEVETVSAMLAGRSKLSLLVETASGISNVERLVRVAGVDEIHVGLNDLSLSLGMSTLFDPLCGDHVELASHATKHAGRRFGFGGVTAPTLQLPVAPELVIAEHVRLGSTVAWLGRSFRAPYESGRTHAASMRSAVLAIRACERRWTERSASELAAAHAQFISQVEAWRSHKNGRPEIGHLE